MEAAYLKNDAEPGSVSAAPFDVHSFQEEGS